MLPEPKKCITKVLYGLITRPNISEQEYRINSFRSILSDLRRLYGIPIRHVDVEGTNEFGKKYVYRRHFLLTISHKKAIKTYMKINNA
jgi:hypothetical protein